MAQTLGLTVPARGPHAHGVPSGTSTSAGGPQAGPRSLGAPEHAVPQAVRETAHELDATSAQVAIPWPRTRSATVPPTLDARNAAQPQDTLRAPDLTPPDHAVRRLEAATDLTPSAPGDFPTQADQAVPGKASARLDGRPLP
ncbi:hypothetical protein DP939_29330 [Spongiactinospora rosea]|uniref:Uncharacterized protein n=1 Tax=Spongiactinospora rosea TaxID=2248750 RepID=A0A366LTS5_9ACTN|nr:hypothetical protein [Spongiactinospora rosea]RBQ16769.1 hypothetical protein DP939_29330 [Spongiactinospora rosea]